MSWHCRIRPAVGRCVLLLAVLFAAGRSVAEEDTPAPKVEVSLLAERNALVPGQTTLLAIEFKLEPEWHIYWQNRGEGGLEPSFQWHLPAGYRVGPMRFPAPVRHVDATDAHTYILKGSPAILTELSVPAGARPGETVTLSADVRWLACKQVCVLGEKTVSIKLPVVEAGARSEPPEDAAASFKAYTRSLPVPADKAKYLRGISVAADVDKIAPGSEFTLAVTVEILPGYHVNSNDPPGKFFIRSDLFPYKTEGLTFGRPTFPKGTVETDAAGTRLSVYRGKAVMAVPVTASATLKGDHVEVGGVFTYQACSDRTGTCFPPASAEWRATLPVAKAGETPRKINADLFAAAGREPAVGEVEAAPPAAGARPIEATRGQPDRGVPPEPGPAPKPQTRPEDEAAAQTTGTSTDAASPDTAMLAPDEQRGVLGRIQDSLLSWGVFGYLVLAFIGGFILNVMPCVLPVISIKILSFVQQAKEHRLRVFTLGLSFSAGILASFLVLGLMILGLLKGVGLDQTQWGGLFQRPGVVIVLASIVTVLALSLFGVFTLAPPRFVNELGGRVKQEGHLGAFAMGLLATVLGTACTAPFLSVVIAAALQQPPRIALLIFATAGVGMAWPYVLLAAVPAWVRLIPRPGPWMKTFEHAMGFLLLGTVVWLLRPLPYQLGIEGLIWTLAFLLCVAAAAWCYGRVEFGSRPVRCFAYYGSALFLVVGGAWWCFFKPAAPEIAWLPYTRQEALERAGRGETVFVDYTAEWCANCKANEKLVLNSNAVRSAIDRLGVVPMKADYTSFDPQIKADLERFKRSGVPMYVILPANRPDEPILLNEILTTSAVLEGLRKAGPSRKAPLSVAAKGS
ncbi:MAG: hypothetical protein AMXMBFR83_25050 [Phycisphaerae bacterium]